MKKILSIFALLLCLTIIGVWVMVALEDLRMHSHRNDPDYDSSIPTQTMASTADTTPATTETQPLPETVSPTVTEPKPRIVCIDAGHQQKAISEKEPNGPGSTEMKAKLSSGTQGVVTRINEYQLNLDISLMLKEELLRRGYEVVCGASDAVAHSLHKRVELFAENGLNEL